MTCRAKSTERPCPLRALSTAKQSSGYGVRNLRPATVNRPLTHTEFNEPYDRDRSASWSSTTQVLRGPSQSR